MTPVKSVKSSSAKLSKTIKAKSPSLEHKTRVTKGLSAVTKRQPLKKHATVEPGRQKNFIQTVGRRKSAIARLRFYASGSGVITVNGQDYKKYFPYVFWQEIITEPLPLVGLVNSADISVKIGGGGLPAQAEAIRLALARALVSHNPDWRPTLRKMGWLTRDPREKERKKPGLKRARRAPQWQKR